MKRILLLTLFIISFTNSLAQQDNFAWVGQIGGTGEELMESPAIDSKGNIYTAGRFTGTVDFDPSDGVYEMTAGGLTGFLLKTDSQGKFVWAKKIEKGVITALTLDSKENIVATGGFLDTCDFDFSDQVFNLAATGKVDLFVLKLDRDGNFIWAKQAGGQEIEGGRFIMGDGSDNIYITGNYRSTVDFNPGADTFELTTTSPHAPFILKLSTDGDFLWVKSFVGELQADIWAMTVDRFGNIYTAGDFETPHDFDPGNGEIWLEGGYFLSKLDPDGNFVWVREPGRQGWPTLNSLFIDKDGNLLVAGVFYRTSDLNFGADTFYVESLGSWDIFILKMDAAGDFLWAKQMGGNKRDHAAFITVDTFGNIYTTGTFAGFKEGEAGFADFDPGEGEFSLESVGEEDAFISKLDSSGNFIWAKQIGGLGSASGKFILIDSLDNVYTFGEFKGRVDFHPGIDSLNLTALGETDVFIHKLGQPNLSGIQEDFLKESLPAFPNPTSDKIFIENPFKNSQTIHIEIYTLQGYLLKELSVMPQAKLHIDLSEQPQGTYLLKLTSGSESFMAKVNVVK